MFTYTRIRTAAHVQRWWMSKEDNRTQVWWRIWPPRLSVRDIWGRLEAQALMAQIALSHDERYALFQPGRARLFRCLRNVFGWPGTRRGPGIRRSSLHQ